MPTSRAFPTSPEEIAAAIARAPDSVRDPATPYDPNNPAEVAAYWRSARVIERAITDLTPAEVAETQLALIPELTGIEPWDEEPDEDG